MRPALRAWAPRLLAGAPGARAVPCLGSNWALLQPARGKKIMPKQTHHLHQEQPRQPPPDNGKKVRVIPKDVPQYDLSTLPSAFEHLRKDPKSGPIQWAAAIAKKIGDRHVTYPHKTDNHIEKDHYRIDYHNMYYFVHSSDKHLTFTAAQKKALLNILAHMHVFGPPMLKTEESEEEEEEE